jgi:hypothetical protein
VIPATNVTIVAILHPWKSVKEKLRKMATGNMTAKLGVKFVEAVQSITNEAAEKLHHAIFRRQSRPN